MRVYAIKDKTAAVVVASHRSVSRNPVRFKALLYLMISRKRSQTDKCCIQVLILRNLQSHGPNLKHVILSGRCRKRYILSEVCRN